MNKEIGYSNRKEVSSGKEESLPFFSDGRLSLFADILSISGFYPFAFAPVFMGV